MLNFETNLYMNGVIIMLFLTQYNRTSYVNLNDTQHVSIIAGQICFYLKSEPDYCMSVISEFEQSFIADLNRCNTSSTNMKLADLRVVWSAH